MATYLWEKNINQAAAPSRTVTHNGMRVYATLVTLVAGTDTFAVPGLYGTEAFTTFPAVVATYVGPLGANSGTLSAALDGTGAVPLVTITSSNAADANSVFVVVMF